MKATKIAVLSGKGGTGKTFVSVNLANVIPNATYIDCDIEAPNGAIFFKPTDVKSEVVNNLIPKFDNDKCVGCRKCVDFCQFNALALINKKVKLFDNLCHSCQGCALVCDYDAISFVKKPVGTIDVGFANDKKIVSGMLNLGIISGNSIIEQAKTYSENWTIIDCPPGAGCEVMETIKDVDYCLIVVEPTLFSYHNYLLVKELMTVMKKNYGILINKANEADDIIFNDNVISRLPYMNGISRKLSNGIVVTDVDKKFHQDFDKLYQALAKEISHE